MRALWLEAGALRLRDDLPPPRPGPGEALVRVRLAGVCATDLALVRGYAGFTGIPGHEFVGEVVAAADGPEWVGRRVVGEINLACGDCPPCRAGRRSHCERRRVLGIRGHHGAFAEYLCLPLANLHPVPDGMDDVAAVFTEPLAAALRIAQQVHVGPGDRVLVVGAGRLGQLVARVLRLTGCELAVVVRHARQRQALAGLGVGCLVGQEVPARGFDLAVEASGSPTGFELARRALRAGGTLVLKSTFPGAVELDLSALVVDEITLVGSRCGPFAPALALLARGLVDPLPLIDARFALPQSVAALARAAGPGVLKVLIQMTR